MAQVLAHWPGEVALANWTKAIKRSALQDLLAVTAKPGILSFALGLPAAELFPTADYGEAAAKVLAEDPRALQYSPPFQPLKAQVVKLMAERGVACNEQQVFLTAGAQQGLSLLARLLLNSRGSVVCEETIYTGFQQAVEPFQPELLTVSTDGEAGIDVDAVEARLRGRARPAFVYVISNGHNPLSTTLTAEKRNRLVQLARRYSVPIVEDDPYGMLSYETISPPLRALDADWVFYVGSFSKILAPSLRVGWLVVPEHLIHPLSVIKEASDIDTSTFSQRCVSAYLDAGHLPGHVAELRREYGRKRDAMLSALAAHFPPEIRWTKPQCGLFVWVQLPDRFDLDEVLKRAIAEERVAFVPGHAFAVNGGRQGANCMRLNFSNVPPGSIEEGITRLARVLTQTGDRKIFV